MIVTEDVQEFIVIHRQDKNLGAFPSLSQLCFGDFNEILRPFEKLEENDGDVKLMFAFRDVIREYEFLWVWDGKGNFLHDPIKYTKPID